MVLPKPAKTKPVLFCELGDQIILNPSKPCLFSAGFDIGDCNGCPHLILTERAMIIPEHETIPVQEDLDTVYARMNGDAAPPSLTDEERKRKELMDHPEFLEID